MKKTILTAALLVAGLAQANVIENFQIGGLSGERQAAWNHGTGGVYSFTNSLDSQLIFTITAVANNGDTLGIGSTHLSVDSSARQTDEHTGRITQDESLTVSVSYVDPNASLVSLKLKEFGAYWGNGDSETTVFTDASANSTNLVGFQHATADNLIDYAATGLDALTKDNTGSWSMTVSVDNTLGTSSSGLGGFELEYEVIPEPATLGLVAMVGAGLIGIRRFFTV